MDLQGESMNEEDEVPCIEDCEGYVKSNVLTHPKFQFTVIKEEEVEDEI